MTGNIFVALPWEGGLILIHAVLSRSLTLTLFVSICISKNIELHHLPLGAVQKLRNANFRHF